MFPFGYYLFFPSGLPFFGMKKVNFPRQQERPELLLHRSNAKRKIRGVVVSCSKCLTKK